MQDMHERHTRASRTEKQNPGAMRPVLHCRRAPTARCSVSSWSCSTRWTASTRPSTSRWGRACPGGAGRGGAWPAAAAAARHCPNQPSCLRRAAGCQSLIAASARTLKSPLPLLATMPQPGAWAGACLHGHACLGHSPPGRAATVARGVAPSERRPPTHACMHACALRACRSSWPPTARTRWTPRCCGRAAWTARSSSPCPTAARSASSSRSGQV